MGSLARRFTTGSIATMSKAPQGSLTAAACRNIRRLNSVTRSSPHASVRNGASKVAGETLRRTSAHRLACVSGVFAYEWLGLHALDERCSEVLFGPMTIGFLDTFRHVFHRRLSAALQRRRGWGKPRNLWKCRPEESLEIQTQDFHPSHRPWKSPMRFPHSHRLDSSLIITKGLRTDSEKCYLCPRIEVLPMSAAGHTHRQRQIPRSWRWLDETASRHDSRLRGKSAPDRRVGSWALISFSPGWLAK
jgi:hypothetical protein